MDSRWTDLQETRNKAINFAVFRVLKKKKNRHVLDRNILKASHTFRDHIGVFRFERTSKECEAINDTFTVDETPRILIAEVTAPVFILEFATKSKLAAAKPPIRVGSFRFNRFNTATEKRRELTLIGPVR